MNVPITTEEINMLRILTNNAQTLQNALQQALNARKAGIALVEKKYKAKFNETTAVFEEVGKPSKDMI